MHGLHSLITSAGSTSSSFGTAVYIALGSRRAHSVLDNGGVSSAYLLSCGVAEAFRADIAAFIHRRHTLGQTYFADMCFYIDMRAALTLNFGAVLDAHVFGDTFDGSMEAFQAWDTVRG